MITKQVAGLRNPPPSRKPLRWHVCRANFARKIFFELRIFLRKMLRNFPRNFWAFVLWVRKNPGKFPPNFPLNLPNFPATNQKTSPTSFCRSAGRTNRHETNLLASWSSHTFAGKERLSACICVRVVNVRCFPLEPCFRKEMPRFSPS